MISEKGIVYVLKMTPTSLLLTWFDVGVGSVQGNGMVVLYVVDTPRILGGKMSSLTPRFLHPKSQQSWVERKKCLSTWNLGLSPIPLPRLFYVMKILNFPPILRNRFLRRRLPHFMRTSKLNPK